MSDDQAARRSVLRREDGRVHGWIKWGGIPTVVAGGIATYLVIAGMNKAGAAIKLAEQAGRDHPAIVENTEGRHEQNALNRELLNEIKNVNKNLKHLVDSSNHRSGRK